MILRKGKGVYGDHCCEGGEERFAFAVSIGVLVEFAGYREHGRDAHATKTSHTRFRFDSMGFADCEGEGRLLMDRA